MRKVGIYLIDPTGKQIASANEKVKSNKLVVEEVSARGEHKIAIWSDLIGDFTVTAKFEAPIEANIKTLEDDISALEADLKRKQVQLEALKANNREKKQ